MEEMMIYDEKNGLWYERRGDYYYPCLTLGEKEQRPIGVWGMRHCRYLKERKKGIYTALLLNGKRDSYLADVNEQAEEMFSRLVSEMMEREGVTERLKADNQMEWVRRVNNIRNRAREMVNADLIYV